MKYINIYSEKDGDEYIAINGDFTNEQIGIYCSYLSREYLYDAVIRPVSEEEMNAMIEFGATISETLDKDEVYHDIKMYHYVLTNAIKHVEKAFKELNFKDEKEN